jgi:hypothetical protein
MAPEFIANEDSPITNILAPKLRLKTPVHSDLAK